MAHTTPFVLTSRVDGYYEHDQHVDRSPFYKVTAVYDGAQVALYKGSAVATSDVAQLITVPANTFVLAVTAKVITAEGGTCTVDIGDGATTDGYIDGFDGNATALTTSSSFNATTTPTFGVGKFYSAADTIDVLLKTGTAAVVKIEVTALMAKAD